MPAKVDQAEVCAFLKSPAAWPGVTGSVDCIETHGALVFMAGQTTLKVRRAVRLPYLDFSTLKARRKFAEREVELNAPHATGLYHGVIAITREADGRLAIGGAGPAVEWAVKMARFGQEALLSAIAEVHGVDDALARSLADAVVTYHAGSPQRPGAVDRVPKIVKSVTMAIAADKDVRFGTAIARIAPLAAAALDRTVAIRAERARDGYIRRCHGDLHLGNVVMWQGRPVPFDAIEFDEQIATIDTLYDLAFLLMDLDRYGARRAANIVLNHYLWRTGDARDLAGLASLPLYVGLRALIRAMVGIDRARLGVGDTGAQVEQALAMIARAESYLKPAPARFVAIGGLSGTGKTTVARALAPWLGAVPGAVHVRSDLERKRLAGVAETERLPSQSYTPEASQAAYSRVMTRAETALRAGQSVIVDAVFARPEERDAVEVLARRCGAEFKGIWLNGAADILKQRVAHRVGDASDATPDIVDKQLGYAIGAMGWEIIAANGSATSVETDVRAALKIKGEAQ